MSENRKPDTGPNSDTGLKLEPRELANVPVPQLADLLPKDEPPATQTEMFAELVA